MGRQGRYGQGEGFKLKETIFPGKERRNCTGSRTLTPSMRGEDGSERRKLGSAAKEKPKISRIFGGCHDCSVWKKGV